MTKTDNCNRLPLLNRLALFFVLAFSFYYLPAQPKPLKGKASYYADFFHGRKTANGERFNMNGLTAAHKSLPFGTILKVTNLDNNKSVMVRVNDRGPYVRGRMLDLSLGAAKMIGMTGKGVANVSIEPVNNKDAYQKYLDKYDDVESHSVPTIVDASAKKMEQDVYLGYETSSTQSNSTEDEPLFASLNPNDNYLYSNVKPVVSYSSDAWNETLKYTPEGTFSMGKALIYPDAQEGMKMSNGELYNSGIYTCAHNKYPLGRYLKVTRKNDPDLSVVVKVTDSHPGISDYDIQLSWTAAADLELFNSNDQDVIIEEIAVTDLDALPEPTAINQPERSVEIAFYNGGAAVTGDAALPQYTNILAAAITPETSKDNRVVAQNNVAGLGLFHMEASRTPESGYGVQVAILTTYREILELSDKLSAHGFQNTMIHSDMINKQEMLRFIVGPYYSKEDAQACKEKLSKENVYGMVIRLEPLGVKD